MFDMYRHTQVGRVVLGLDLAIALLLGIPGVIARQPSMLIGAGVAVLVLGLFSTLTIAVRDGALRFHFGPGIWGKTIPLNQIADAEVASSSWYEGIGIRFTTRGMLYNVAAGPAVELRLQSGRRFRLGTDEPAALLHALGTPPA
jgi:hypothetical protein